MKKKFGKIVQSYTFRRYGMNTLWLLSERILRITVGFFVGVWVARYLGPHQLGIFSYVQSFVGLFAAIATLGLDSIIIREMIKNEDKRNELLGTAFLLKLVGVILLLAILGVIIYFASVDSYTSSLVFIVASATLFQSFNVIDFYFQSKVLSKYVVYANVISLCISSIIKIVLILNKAPLIAFALVVILDSLVLALGLVYFFIINSTIKSFEIKWSKNIAVNLLKDSWPLIFSGLAVGFGMRLDQVLLKNMFDAHSVGIYSAGVRLAEPLVFLPVIIFQSVFPKIVSWNFVKNQLEFVVMIRSVFYFLLLISVVIALLSNNIVTLLYGSAFNDSSIVLMILIFSIPFTSLNIFTSKVLVNENMQKAIVIRQVVLLLLNISLNLLLIPLLGVVGAALATVFSDLITGLIIDYFIKDKTKTIFFLKVEAIFFTKRLEKNIL